MRPPLKFQLIGRRKNIHGNVISCGWQVENSRWSLKKIFILLKKNKTVKHFQKLFLRRNSLLGVPIYFCPNERNIQ